MGRLCPGLVCVVPGRHGDQVVGRRRPSRRLLAECYGRALCVRSEAHVVTVEADVDQVERRLAAGELSCPSCGVVLAGWGRGRPRQLRGVDGPG